MTKAVQIGIGVLMLLGLMAAPVLATGNIKPIVKKESIKVDVCHQTESEKNPWEAINISENAVATHLEHGDFLINDENPCPPKEEEPKDEPEATPSATVETPKATTLPDTGYNWLIIGGVLIVIAGGVVALYQYKK